MTETQDPGHPSEGVRVGRLPSWRKVADELASRLTLNEPCDAHGDPYEDMDCPFCHDRRAVELYQRKVRASDDRAAGDARR